MIVIIGDTHADINKLLSALHGLCENDYLIVTGDFGFIFRDDEKEKMLLDSLEKTKVEILFVDGNHENFDVLNSYPIEIWNGGKVHQIQKNIRHLMRGQVYSIDNKRFFTFGGARSNDLNMRIKGRTWWPEELPNNDEYKEALKNLCKCGMKVDFIITHQAPGVLQSECGNYNDYSNVFDKDNELLAFFDRILTEVEFNKWFCGHFHIDKELSKKVQAVYMGRIIIE